MPDHAHREDRRAEGVALPGGRDAPQGHQRVERRGELARVGREVAARQRVGEVVVAGGDRRVGGEEQTRVAPRTAPPRSSDPRGP